MARIRTIKPDFFTDEKLAECCIEARFLFVGLIIHVDDEGRMEYSAKRTAMQIFPCMRVSIDAWMAELEAQKLVTLYEVGSRRFLCIPGFTKHQRIHPSRKSESKLPSPADVPRGTDQKCFQGSKIASEGATNYKKSREVEVEVEVDKNNTNTCMSNDAIPEIVAPSPAPRTKSRSLNDATPLQIDPSEGIDASMAARKVFEEVGLAGNDQLLMVTDAVKSCAKRTGTTFASAGDLLVNGWRLYDETPMGKYKCRVFKFFKAGLWQYDIEKWKRLADGSDAVPESRATCPDHPDSGLTQWGTCWTCYELQQSGGVTYERK